MSSEELERKIEFIIEQQARFSAQMDKLQENAAAIQEAVLGLIQVARTHDEQIDRNSGQIKELGKRVDTLIRVVESHVSNHP